MPFTQTPPQAWSLEREPLLQAQIHQLGLNIEGTYLDEHAEVAMAAHESGLQCAELLERILNSAEERALRRS